MYFTTMFAPIIPAQNYAYNSYTQSLYYMFPIPQEQANMILTYMKF